MAGSVIYPTRPYTGPNPAGAADSDSALLVRIIVDTVCKFLSKLKAPCAHSVVALVQTIMPFFKTSSIPVAHQD